MNDYCFSVSWDGGDTADSHIIKAKDRDEAWSELCRALINEGHLPQERFEKDDFNVELQFVVPDQNRSNLECRGCGKLGAHVRGDGRYWHEECWDQYREDARMEEAER